MKSQDDSKISAIVRSSTNTLFYCAVQIPFLIDIGATTFREGDMGMDDAIEIIVASAAEISVLPQQKRIKRRSRKRDQIKQRVQQQAQPQARQGIICKC